MSSGRKPKPHPATAARRIGTLLLNVHWPSTRALSSWPSFAQTGVEPLVERRVEVGHVAGRHEGRDQWNGLLLARQAGCAGGCAGHDGRGLGCLSGSAEHRPDAQAERHKCGQSSTVAGVSDHRERLHPLRGAAVSLDRKEDGCGD